jgi:hypothetical protein
VISDESEPMAGANVLIESTSRGVITDSKGQFFIDYIRYKKISKTLIVISEYQDQETSYLEKIGVDDNTDIEFDLSHSNLLFKIVKKEKDFINTQLSFS